MSFLLAVVRRDLLVHWRRLGDVANPIVFFLICVSLVPIGVGGDRELLPAVAPGVIWVTALLATMLSLDNVFRGDFEDGSLEQMTLSPAPLALIVIGKVIAHWLVSGVPLILLAPLVALMFQMDATAMGVLTLSALLATPTLSLIGAVGASLTVGLPRGGLLIAILVLPLVVPVLILATAMVQLAMRSIDYGAQVNWLLALLFLALCLAPVAASAGLRVAMERR